MPTLTLQGCAPVPLAHYLKALGILRLVAKQCDAKARASWQHDRLALHTALTPDALVSFFSKDYRPSPVLAPWNGGSGFFPKDNDEAISAIGKSSVARLVTYRDGIAAAREALKALKLKAKPDGETKALLLQSCRNSFPEDALGWLDAVFVLGQDSPKFPPLLGTGGNDGRLEFTNNFMQRITEVMDPATGQPTADSERWLRAALFAEAAPGLATKAPIGQFFPGAAGGANATSGFDAASAVNPWDFILMIEGALLFAAATVKRLESADDGSLVYPFCVRQAGVGYASAAGADEAEARCEMWMPLWTTPTTLAELRAIFSEGRAQVRGRAARTGVDFSQAVVTLGVDRGIAAFQRYGFQVRNGLAYFATPLGKFNVRRSAQADLLADFRPWMSRLRMKTDPKAKPKPPNAVKTGFSVVERRIIELCHDDSAHRMQALLAALGATERAVARSFSWAKEKDKYQRENISPLRGLRPEWLERVSDCTETRLAAALASSRASFGQGKETIWFRQHLEPLKRMERGEGFKPAWSELSTENDVAWHDGDLTDSLNAILSRRLIRVQKSGARGWPDWSPCTAALDDITAFIERRVNEPLLADLIWGLSLMDWETLIRDERAKRTLLGVPPSGGTASAPASDAPEAETALEAEGFPASSRWLSEATPPENHAETNRTPAGVPAKPAPEAIPSAFYALLRLCFRRKDPREDQDAIPLVPAILHRAIAGDGTAASKLAARRLRASGHAPLIRTLPVAGDIARRTAAAMLFPIAPRDLRQLERMILQHPTIQDT
jgi:CRISPR-associated protein Csx17